MPFTPSRVQIGAELMRQDLIVDTPHTANPDRLAALAPSDTRLTHGLDGPAPWGHGSMFHPRTKPVSRVSYRGQKGIPYTYRVSPQQAETGQLLQRSDPVGPGADPSLVAVEDRLPCNV